MNSYRNDHLANVNTSTSRTRLKQAYKDLRNTQGKLTKKGRLVFRILLEKTSENNVSYFHYIECSGYWWRYLRRKNNTWHPLLVRLVVIRSHICSQNYTFLQKEYLRCEQDSNLRGETPLDFKSNALTTRPSQLVIRKAARETIISDTFFIRPTLESFERCRRFS